MKNEIHVTSTQLRKFDIGQARLLFKVLFFDWALYVSDG